MVSFANLKIHFTNRLDSKCPKVFRQKTYYVVVQKNGLSCLNLNPQKKKMLADILKMLLLEKVTNRTYRKIIVICDDAVLKAITGKS
jgi:hypothetical protein